MTENKNASTETAVEIVDAAPAGSLSLSGFGSNNLRHTFRTETFEDKVKILDAMTNSVPLAENIGKVIQVANLIVKKVVLPNERTGELEESARITLVDADGKSYHATSSALYNALDDILSVVGGPSTWNAPLPIKIERVKANGPGHFFTAKIAV